ncbi:MAG: SUMF1/EgtB/PvdO family nonheme iron enzyme [Anaerolinea sp.]|nr:SUMF1/EgtB/PvdO family nonheme iron enzyme [Anaerolinea sp.]MCC6974035.1 SUMF1/EgtB/PvdO family nonheme iron enzyme [Anaerolineae bacterium]
MTIPVKADVSLWEQLQFLPVPAGTAILGLEDKVVERFINAYGEDWRVFFLREAPFHQVEVGAFELSRYPVTNGIYAQFMAEGGYDDPELWTPDGWAWRVQTKRVHPLHWADPRFAGEDRPVVGVSWFEAMAVARWASIKTGRKVRLPSEAEWEYAARADNLKSNYPWGGAWDPQKLNSGFNDEKHRSIGSTTPVGAFSPVGDAPFGHAEMLGQVWEWTNSLFRPYPFNALDGREDRYSPEGRIMRGGNWADGKYVNRVTTRYYYPPYYSDKTNGFRLAADGDAPEIAERPPYDLVVYGRSTFCPDLVTLKRWLHQWNVPHRQVQIDLDERAAYRLDEWLGARTVPTLVMARRGEVEPFEPPVVIDLSKLRNQDRGSMLHEPDEVTLRAFLVRFGFQV